MTYNIDRGCFENCFDFLLGSQKEEGMIQSPYLLIKGSLEVR